MPHRARSGYGSRHTRRLDGRCTTPRTIQICNARPAFRAASPTPCGRATAIEFRAQVEAALAAGLEPTHVDWHCLGNGGRDDIFDLTMGLANECGLALRVASQPYIAQVQRQGLPTNEHDLLDSFRLSIGDKSARYAQMLRELPEGLSEWAVHPSLGDADSQAIDPEGWRVRRTDFDFLVSPQAREIIHEEGITLLGYEPLQKVWQGRSS